MNLKGVVKKRIVFLFLIFWLGFYVISIRLAWVQMIKGEELQKKALSQWTQEVPVEPKRGTIFDTKGRELAISASADTIVAYPPDIEDPEKASSQISEILDLDKDRIYELLTRNRASVYLKRKVDSEKALEIRKLRIKGIGFTEESKRYYPDRNLVSHVLGFVGIDNQGLAGIEYEFDKYLKGYPGRIVSEADAFSRELPFGSRNFIPAINGYDIVLTIDRVIQHFAERELEMAMKRHNAKGGTIIIMRPNSGEILAMVNKPDFDPNNYQNYPSKLWNNSAVCNSFEPGSTFKIVTAAAGLEEALVTKDTPFFDKGYAIVSGVRIKCWKHGGHGQQTFLEVVENSCNPGFIDLGMKIGKERLVKYINSFGFGRRTGISFPGEARGIFNPDSIGPVELATMSFGHGISVTAIQLINSLCAVINGGNLMEPMLVKKIKNELGEVIYKFEPKVISNVISKKTSSEMKEFLESAVVNGTGNTAYIEGYRIGGKTGTAEKYIDGKYVGSFIGFAPANNPKVAILVVIDEPEGIYYGGRTAAPAFKNVMEDTLRYLGIEESYESE